MKEIWVLSVRTSLPKVCNNVGDLAFTFDAFETFEAARTAFRAKINGYAFSKNAMFDGDGNIIYLKEYIEDMLDEEYDEGWLSKYRLAHISDMLHSIFEGEDIAPELCEGTLADGMIAYTYENGEISFYGMDDGPYNGYDPVIKTNMFSMNEAKDYFLYIDDMLGQYEASAELYIDLKKCMLG